MMWEPPPFGHFGEFAINKWFDENIDTIFNNTDRQSRDALPEGLIFELKNFEGNAQAVRLISHLISLNLTYAQIASLIKYIRPGFIKKPEIDDSINYLYKKVGYYWSEKELIAQLVAELSLNEARHPFVYIMEAADDISYCLADIEDAVEKGIITINKLKELILYHLGEDGKVEVGQSNESIGDILNAIIERPYEHMDDVGSFFVQFRAKLIHILVNYAAMQFINNIEPIFYGKFNQALMEAEGVESKLTQALKNIAVEYVFSDPEVRTLELKGYKIIYGLLECYSPILFARYEDFYSIVEAIIEPSANKKIKIKNKVLVHLVYRLAKKHVRSYSKAIESLDSHDANFDIKELYYRCRLIQDYISGMTDQFAFDEYRELTISGCVN